MYPILMAQDLNILTHIGTGSLWEQNMRQNYGNRAGGSIPTLRNYKLS
jgi:hypothetical protein